MAVDTLSPNADISWLAAHSTLNQLAWGISGVFFSAVLLRAGFSPSLIFLAVAGILATRFALRPLVLVFLPRLGPRGVLILGTVLSAFQFPAFALVRGPGVELLIYGFAAAISGVFYWTCYHAFFAALGDSGRRGRQLGMRQLLSTISGVAGPVLGGFMLARFEPLAAFGMAGLVEAVGILPLLFIAEPPYAREAPAGAYAATGRGAALFFSDGWITSGAFVAWDIVAFRALGERYEAFGGMLAAAALAGAVAGLVLGRFVDAGRVRRTASLNAAALLLVLLAKALCGSDPAWVVATAALSAMLGGLYIPALMIAVYDEAKASPCPLRFQFAAEGGWDIGGTAATGLAAAICYAGWPLQAVIALALPAVILQGVLLSRHYAGRGGLSA